MSVATKIMNLFPTLILKSPMHAVMSDEYAILEFTGRRTGKTYETPVAYVQEGDTVLLSTDSRWWRNFSDDAVVTLRLRGRRRDGTAHLVRDAAQAEGIVRTLVTEIPSYARPAGLKRVDGHVPPSEISRTVAEGRRAIEVRLRE